LIAAYEWFGFEMPDDELYGLIKNAGFDGVLLDWDARFNGLLRDNPEKARSAGLFIENIHTSTFGANDLCMDNMDGAARLEHLLQCVSDCAAFDIPVMVVHLKQGFMPPSVNALELECLTRVTEKAERNGVKIACENTSDITNLSFVFDKIRSPALGLCFDAGHAYCRNPFKDMLAAYGDRLFAVHLHDNDGYKSGKREEDQHKLPFDGTVDWPLVMKKIAETGYKGSVAVEVENTEYKNVRPEELINEAYKRAVKLKSLMS